MRKKFFYRLLLLLMTALMTVSLSGCGSSMSVLNKTASATLPPATVEYIAPTGDTHQERAQNVLIYVPNAAGTRLIAQNEKISVSAARHPAEATLRRLFAFEGSEEAQPLTELVSLQLSAVNPVEISGNTATVNLAASALSLPHSSLYIVCQAIANTLTQWGDIEYVNVLVSSVQPGLDVAASVPVGAFTADLSSTIDDLSTEARLTAAVDAQTRLSLPATLYFPTYSGKGILAETRTLTFASRDRETLITTLLAALSQGAQSLTNVPAVPDISSYLAKAVSVQEIPTSGNLRAMLSFKESLNDALINAGIPRSVMLAAITYTVTAFVPGICGLTVTIGDELISVVVPNGIYENANQPISFTDGIMRRADFSAFLLSNCTLYFSDDKGKLAAVQRPVPYYEARSARYLISCLAEGPQPWDHADGVYAVLPEGLTDADLLGIGLSSQTLLLNFSRNTETLFSTLSANEEKLAAYAIINTLTNLSGITEICFFFDGTQPEALAGGLYWPGTFLKNPGLIK